MKVEREYQTDTIQKSAASLERGISRQLICLATGMGKTYIASCIRKNFAKVLFISHTEELIEQSALSFLVEEEFCSPELLSHIQREGGIIDALNSANRHMNLFGNVNAQELTRFKQHVGIIKQERMDIDSAISFASIQTLHKRLAKIPTDTFDLIVVDECHLAMSKSYQKVLAHFTPKLCIGLTATPTRLDGMSLFDLFDEMIVDYGIEYGIQNGYLVEIEAVRVKTEIGLDDIKKVAGDLNIGQLEKILNTPVRNRLIVDKYKELLSDKQALVFAVDVQHAVDLNKMFISQGIKSAVVVGDENICPNRKELIRQFKSGELKVLVNVLVLTAGFDHDMIEGVIMARPTTSLTIYLQSIGRGTRTEKGIINNLHTAPERLLAISKSKKPKLLIVDIVDNTRKHNLVNTWTLDRDKEIEDKVFTTREQKDKAIEKREAAKQQRKLQHTQDKDERVNLLKPPTITISNSASMKEDATEKQIEFLNRLGFDTVNNHYTKGMASEAINSVQASDKQIYAIKMMGYDVSKGITITQAKQIFTMEDEKKGKTSLPPVAKPTISPKPKGAFTFDSSPNTNTKQLFFKNIE